MSIDNTIDIDLRIVDIERIRPNEYNPNEMTSELYEILSKNIKEEGVMNQPILVRPHAEVDGEFVIVDGENRYTAAKLAGIPKLAVVVVNYDETTAKIRTLSYNAIHGQNVPIKLARMLVDLQKEYTDYEIRQMTGIREDEQENVLNLLEIPDFKTDSGIGITVNSVDRPIPVTLMLMPDEHQSYTMAMKKAMRLAGEEVTVLIGNEVGDYNKAMTEAMGMSGLKLRNLALASICTAFNEMGKDAKQKVVETIKNKILEKRIKDAEYKEESKTKTDKKVSGRERKRM